MRNRYLRARGQLALVLIGVFLLGGCIKQTTEGGTTTFAFEMWVALLTLFGTIAAPVIGFFLRKVQSRIAWVLMLAGPTVFITVAPNLFRDAVTVSNEKFTVNVGFWMRPTQFDERFADLASIDLVEEATRGRRGRTEYKDFLVCNKKSGGQDKMLVDQLIREALPMIADRAQAAGIALQDLRPK